MIKIVIISLITVFLSLILKQKSLEFSAVITVCGGVLILILTFDYVTELIGFYVSFGEAVSIESSVIKIALKLIGVGFLTEFISDLANDFGNSVVASKVVFGGRVVICLIMLPVLKDLISLLSSFY